jgi:hypothetical protein
MENDLGDILSCILVTENSTRNPDGFQLLCWPCFCIAYVRKFQRREEKGLER